MNMKDQSEPPTVERNWPQDGGDALGASVGSSRRPGGIANRLGGPRNNKADENQVSTPIEAGVFFALEAVYPGFARQVYTHPTGGGQLLAAVQVRKRTIEDNALPRKAAMLMFRVDTRLRHAVLIDEDVDPFNLNDVLLAMATRCRQRMRTRSSLSAFDHDLAVMNTLDATSETIPLDSACSTAFDCTKRFTLPKRAKPKRLATSAEALVEDLFPD